MKKETHLKIAKIVVKLLENQFTIWKFKFGLDPILGLFPGAGDLIPAILSFYIVFVAIIHKLPWLKILRMVVNIFLDFLIGVIPVLGDFFDFIVNPNTKNMAILEQYLKDSETILEGGIIE